VSQESHGKIKATKRHSDTESLEEETEVVSFLREVLGKKRHKVYKKGTSLYKKKDMVAQNRQANLYKLSPKRNKPQRG
jgi:hypothetical protein